MKAARVEPVEGIGEVEEGQSLAELIAARVETVDGIVFAISQKVVSKAEGRLRSLDRVPVSARAGELAAELGKEPALVQLVLDESSRVVRSERGVLITETRQGLICANAGIDSSNVPGERMVALLPEDPDGSARRIRAELQSAGQRCAVVISDSFGRPWRLGQAEVAIGCAGIDPIADWRGRLDSDGTPLQATAIAFADELAAAADLVRDKASRTPVVAISGLGSKLIEPDGPGAAALIRPAGEDLFR